MVFFFTIADPVINVRDKFLALVILSSLLVQTLQRNKFTTLPSSTQASQRFLPFFHRVHFASTTFRRRSHDGKKGKTQTRNTEYP
jgi:hypothetical protein